MTVARHPRGVKRLTDFDEERQGRSDAFYMFAEICGQIVKVSLNGSVLKLTWGNNQYAPCRFHLVVDVPEYWPRHDAQYYVIKSISETKLGTGSDVLINVAANSP